MYEITEFRRKSINAYIGFLDKQKILIGCLSRTHELTNNLIYKAPRSNRQVTKRTPSIFEQKDSETPSRMKQKIAHPFPGASKSALNKEKSWAAQLGFLM
ncbi:hypothetical protein GQ457_03G010390 [Hibiscus cannabinus]